MAGTKQGRRRTFDEELAYFSRDEGVCGNCRYVVKKGFVPGMNVEGHVYVNDSLRGLLLEELRLYCSRGGASGFGFLPALKQVGNVAALPGIVGHSIGLPDIHAGYGFAIGNVAAFDMSNPKAVVSPGGVGFDINCGVRLLRTNLTEEDVVEQKEQLAQALFDHIPVGVGSEGIIPCRGPDLEAALELGMDWNLREGYAWVEDKEHCEEYGRMLLADPRKVSARAKKRGLPQMGTLGAGNHYCEIQAVDEIFDEFAARQMGIEQKGQICVMIHSGSRGLGHQVATDALVAMDAAAQKSPIITNDRQLACAPISSKEGQDYLAAMSAAANYAWVNRSSITFLARAAFSSVLRETPDDLDMHVVYDVSHNVAKVEEHMVGGSCRQLLVHRKGSTRAFPPHHPAIPCAYQLAGQPVLIGGTMGTCSYILTGTEKGLQNTFGSTCHGAGRAKSRNLSRNQLDYQDVLRKLAEQQISARGPRKHMKRIAAPHHWLLDKLTGHYAPRPSPGPHKLRECIPLVVLLRNRLKYALTSREVLLIVMQRLIKVDGKVRTDTCYPAGSMDVISVEKTKEHFRLLLDTKGRFIPHRIRPEEATYKLCRIKKVLVGSKGVPAAVTHDGRTLRFPHPAIKAHDSVRLHLETGEILDWVSFEAGNVAMVTGGHNVGRVGIVGHRERHPGGFDIVHLRDAKGHEFATRISNVFIIGKGDRPWISLPKEKGIRLSIFENRALQLKKQAHMLQG